MKKSMSVLALALLSSCASLTTNFKTESGRCIVIKSKPTAIIAAGNSKTESVEQLDVKIGDTLSYSGCLKKVNFGSNATFSYLVNVGGKNYFIEEADAQSIERRIIRNNLYITEYPKDKAEEYWSKAIAFVMDNSEMKIQTQTDYMLQTFNPLKENQRGWTLQKIVIGDKVKIKADCIVKGGYLYNFDRQILRFNWYLNTGEIKSEAEVLTMD